MFFSGTGPWALIITRHFRKRNWIAFKIINISELEKGNSLLYMAHVDLNFTMVYLSFS